MEVILIRHTSVDVPPGMCYGQTDVPLKPTFETEAAVTAENLKAYLPFDHVYTSPLTVACASPPIAAIPMQNGTNGLWKSILATGR